MDEREGKGPVACRAVESSRATGPTTYGMGYLGRGRRRSGRVLRSGKVGGWLCGLGSDPFEEVCAQILHDTLHVHLQVLHE